ncbi:MAG: hypothetical protein KKI08_05490 [Armatimonadetes bacterium]|nr:hypothetical protein [Armatimonadota bacterium]
MGERAIQVNRAPVLTLWGAVVAERRGHDWPAALTIGRVLSGLMAQSKGRQLGVFGPPKAGEGGKPKKTGLGEDCWVELCGRGVPCKHTADGLRAVVEDKAMEPETVEKYLKSKFGEALPEVLAAMRDLAAAYEPDELDETAYRLYEGFRPQITPGKAGWGQKGTLDLDTLAALARRE